MSNNKEFHLFISYSHKDKKFKYKLVNSLKEIGFTVWIDDKDIQVGKDWVSEIDMGISASRFLLYLGSPNAAKSTYVAYELGYAKAKNVDIIPLRIRKDDWKQCIPDWLVLTQGEELYNRRYDKGFTRLLNGLIQLIKERIHQELLDKKLIRESTKLADILGILREPYAYPPEDEYEVNKFKKLFEDIGTDWDSLDVLITWGLVIGEHIDTPWDDRTQPPPLDIIRLSLTKLGHYLREHLK